MQQLVTNFLNLDNLSLTHSQESICLQISKSYLKADIIKYVSALSAPNAQSQDFKLFLLIKKLRVVSK